jgi:TrmH family RNA methyltransferase
MLEIASTQNETYKKFLSLTSAKGLKKEGLLLLSGEKLVREFLDKPRLKIVFEAVAPRMKPVAELSGAKMVELASELFAQIDVLGTHSNILVLEQPKVETLGGRDLAIHKPQGIEIVLPVGDPGNLGALIRSCEAFAVPRVILTKEAAHPFLPKAVKASAGSVLRVPLIQGPSLPEFPDDCIALDMDGVPINEFQWPHDGLLIVGEEGAGFAAKTFNRRVRIPTEGVQSLNVVVAASIALANRAGTGVNFRVGK